MSLQHRAASLGSGTSLSSLHLANGEYGKQARDHVSLWDAGEQAGAKDAKKESHSLLDDDKTMVK